MTDRPKRPGPVPHAPRTHTAILACKVAPTLKQRFVHACYARGDLPGVVLRKLVEAFTMGQEKKS